MFARNVCADANHIQDTCIFSAYTELDTRYGCLLPKSELKFAVDSLNRD
jgi:hypothetical protein